MRCSILAYLVKNCNYCCARRYDVRGRSVCIRLVPAEMSTEDAVVELSPADIPGADLPTPYEQHTVAALRWWLLCRGIQAPTSWRKKQLVDRCDIIHMFDCSLNSSVCMLHRVKEADLQCSKVVDVDGSYLYRKYRSLVDSGVTVSFPECPPPPITGWLSVSSNNCATISLSIPTVTSGKLFVDICI